MSIEPLERLRVQCVGEDCALAPDQLAALDDLLSDAIRRADAAEVEVLTVMNPVSRPQRLQLATIVSDAGLDTMYRQEWAELSASHDGRCFLVYRRRDGNHYAIQWTKATTLPASMLDVMPEPLTVALLRGDGDE